jgi:folylpolyglutamate synthase/dihydropteroate synthase
VGGKIACRAIGNARSALDYVLAGAECDDIILVAGSLYLLGEIRPMLEAATSANFVQKNADPPV